MTAEEIREYCLKKNAVEEGFPFDNETLVFKVAGKMFLLLALDSYDLVSKSLPKSLKNKLGL